MSVSLRITNIQPVVKDVNSAINRDRVMDLGLPDGGEDGELTGVGFVEISEVFVMQNTPSFGMKSFNSIIS